MATQKWEIFLLSFRVICICVVISSITRLAYDYSLNEDLCLVDFKDLEDEDVDLYPTLSLCFNNPFLNDKLIHNHGVNESLYLDFLNGDYFSTEMLHIDYEEVTFDLKDYIKQYFWEKRDQSMVYRTVDNNGSNGEEHLDENGRRMVTPRFNGFRYDVFIKCFALHIPHDVKYFSVRLSADIFRNKTRPPYHEFSTFLHHPTQMMLSIPTEKSTWPPRKDETTFEMMFVINGIEFIKRRNKKDKACVDSSIEYDPYVISSHNTEIGCEPPYQNRRKSQNMTLCDTKDKMKRVQFPFNSEITHKFDPPCEAIQKLYYTYEDVEMDGSKWVSNGDIWISVMLRDTQYKAIIQSRYTLRRTITIFTLIYQGLNECDYLGI